MGREHSVGAGAYGGFFFVWRKGGGSPVSVCDWVKKSYPFLCIQLIYEMDKTSWTHMQLR